MLISKGFMVFYCDYIMNPIRDSLCRALERSFQVRFRGTTGMWTGRNLDFGFKEQWLKVIPKAGEHWRLGGPVLRREHAYCLVGLVVLSGIGGGLFSITHMPSTFPGPSSLIPR